MAHIPTDAEWYLAEIVEEFRIEGETANVVMTNLTLVHATCPEDAYCRAMDLGTAEERTYLNPDHKTVTVRFAGLRDLNVIHDKLEHGAGECPTFR